jgi:hypothetical protein
MTISQPVGVAPTEAEVALLTVELSQDTPPMWYLHIDTVITGVNVSSPQRRRSTNSRSRS